ncbi:MAG TPA: aspartyl protease family protein [Rhizomicrobium sp.]|jgi:predicted aspartyl protease|nr:aspartyl protease family protein [Rhizomicrobium sp.]
MRNTFAVLALAAMAATPVYAASPADILAANKAASGGAAWDGKAAVKASFAYAGQGMTGKIDSLEDLSSGQWTDTFAIGPATGASGFDGTRAWEKDPSGAVTAQDGGDQRQVAVNDGYRRANLWWRADFGGAQIADAGQKTDGGNSYDVLTVTPKNGKAFDAWFDAKTHLLSRVVEQQGTQTITTTLSDYRAIDGAEFAGKAVINNGDAKYDQAVTVTSAAFVAAPGDAAFAMPKVVLTDTTVTGGQTTLPFRLINNHIYADVKVNGAPYKFIFDTGGVNLVTPTTAKALGLKSEGQMQGSGAGSGHMDVGLTKVSSLQIGGATIKDQVFAVLPLDAMANIEGVGMPGMVGFETFRRFVTRVDYGNGTLTLIDPKKFDPKDAGIAVPFTFNGNTIEIQAAYNGVPGNFTIDTGARSSLTVSAPFVTKNNLRTASTKGTEGVTGWGIGGPSRAFATRGDDLKMGSFDVKGPVVELSTDTSGAMADPSLGGNIGAGILKRYVVTLDYDHSTMYLKPGTAIADLDTFDRAGLWFNEDGKDAFKIVDVTKGAPAQTGGLQVGDEITAVDGKPVSGIHLYDLRARLRNDAPGTVVTFTVKGSGGSKDVKVTLRDLI